MKWFEFGCILALMLGLAEMNTLPVGGECQIGSSWSSPCYSCNCSEEGRAICTKKECEEKDAEQPGHCAPDTNWKNDCNRCFCTENGLSACTKRGCLPPPLPVVQTKVISECLAGTSWESNCHRCECSADGQALCNKMPCDEKAVLDEPIRCKPNTTFARDCNTCMCLDNGNVLCSLKGCIDLYVPPTKIVPVAETAAPIPTGRECAVGTTWKSKCNQCFCSPLGYASCTEIGCLGDTGPDFRCQPESRWVDDCNTCSCTLEGFPVCTKVGCGESSHKVPEMDFGQNDTEISESTETNPLQVLGVQKRSTCVPGDVIKMECNTCKCNDDGTGYDACTKVECITLPPSDVTTSQKERPKREIHQSCEPGQSFKIDCNTCQCNDDGTKYSCTKIGCFHIAAPGQEELKERPKREIHESCEPGQSFKVDCNTCQCNGDGTKYSCTKIGCLHIAAPGQEELAQVYNDRFKRAVCKPTESYQQECNTCVCDSEGVNLKCTENECMSNEGGDVEVFKETEGTDHIERHSVCQPSTTFKINCNTCECNYDGTDYRCSDEACPLPDDVELFKELQDEAHIVPLKKCLPKGAFEDGCNKCYCNEDGTDYHCTKIICKGTQMKKTKYENKEQLTGKTVASLANKSIVCQANKAFQKDCNTCWCNEDGTGYFCTRKVCIPNLPEDVDATEGPEELRIIQKECRPEEVFELDCNMCRCNADGKSFSCTRRACVTDTPPDVVDYESKSLPDASNVQPARPKRETTQQQKPSQCKSGEKFRLDCNTCLCHTDGQEFSCTRYDCHPPPSTEETTRRRREVGQQDKQDCQPGTVFSQDCNVCRCTNDGRHATCTLKRCDKLIPKPKDEGDADLGFRCTPGEQFKRNCNDCTCSADGKSVFCTIKLCENDIVSQL